MNQLLTNFFRRRRRLFQTKFLAILFLYFHSCSAKHNAFNLTSLSKDNEGTVLHSNQYALDEDLLNIVSSDQIVQMSPPPVNSTPPHSNTTPPHSNTTPPHSNTTPPHSNTTPPHSNIYNYDYAAQYDWDDWASDAGDSMLTGVLLNAVPFLVLSAYYRATVNFTSLPWEDSLDNSGSAQFQQTADLLYHTIEELYKDIAGEQFVTIIKFDACSSRTASDGTLVSMDIGTVNNDHMMSIMKVLQDAVQTGTIDKYNVSMLGFSFRVISSGADSKSSEVHEKSPAAASPAQYSAECRDFEFKCADGSCIDKLRKCDKVRHCEDGTDEDNDWADCNSDPEIIVLTGDQTKSVGQSLHFVATVDNLGSAIVLWVKAPQKIIAIGGTVVSGDKRILAMHQRGTNRYELRIQNLRPEDAGDYNLWVDMRSRKLTASATLTVIGGDRLPTRRPQPQRPPTRAPERRRTRPPVRPDLRYQTPAGDLRTRAPWIYPSTPRSVEYNFTPSPQRGWRDRGRCGIGYSQCSSGHCLDDARWCDGTVDCPTRDDELHCTETTRVTAAFTSVTDYILGPQCTVHQYQCANGQCIQIARHCDKVPDCLDASDEADCPHCSSSEFQCKDGRCLSEDGRCNGIQDCLDGSDEVYCTNPARSSPAIVLCSDGSSPFPSVYGSMYCWSANTCPPSTKCLNRICCKTNTGNDKEGCTRGQFQCSNMICIDEQNRCDRKYDCTDGSDELNCQYTRAFHSTTSVHRQVYTNAPYRPDRTTPPPPPFLDYSVKCESHEFRCATAPHVDSRPGRFSSRDLLCIDARRRCDGYTDCQDASDEKSCLQDAARPVQGRPIEEDHRSGERRRVEDDGRRREEERRLLNERRRLEQERRRQTQDRVSGREGDNIRRQEEERRRMELRRRQEAERNREESRRGTLEWAARPLNTSRTDTCAPDHFQCRDGSCIDKVLHCDRKYDCKDGTDETTCEYFKISMRGRDRQPTQVALETGNVGKVQPPAGNTGPRICSAMEFQCLEGEPRCIDVRRRCDSKFDCRDASDETRCPPDDWPNHYDEDHIHDVHLQAIPNDLSIREGREAVFDCVIKGTTGTIHWTKLGGKFPSSAKVRDGSLIIRHSTPEHSGTYICSGAGKETRVQLEVRKYGPFLEQTGPGRCGREQKTCQNGECVQLNLVCDGHSDCRDGSDEQNCPVLRACEPNEFLCDNRKMCVQKHWVCDGDNDCYDNSDEKNCGNRKPGDTCEPWEFQCTSTRDRQCVPSSYQCDGHGDCIDGSDEVGCVKPTVAQPPPPSKRVQLGETIILECRAVGVPVPHINWRLNWGDICNQDVVRDRCTQTSVNGYGVLTIKDARGSDAGAYTCEAINIKGRVLAVPDCIVRVDAAQNNCNPAGTFPPGTPDSRGQCPCKRYTTGLRCDQCAAGSFYLNERNPHGCLQCFCSGITKQCTSSSYFRSQERLTFNSGDQGVILTDFSERNPLRGANIQLNSPRGFITHSDRHSDTLFWKLPSSLLGERVTAYGGKLEFRFKFTGGSAIPSGEPLVVIKGNDITLVHRPRDDRNQGYAPDTEHRIIIDMYETSWEREDGRPGDREHLLMTLSQLTSILIRATHSAGQSSTSLGEVALDIAVDRDTQQERAWAVEQCSCPRGYRGLSCEECASGYERSGGGMYLGTCVPMRQQQQVCNPTGTVQGYPDADPRTGQCRCKPYVTGPRCDQCAAHAFYFSDRNPHGCIQCFCSGVTKDCSSSNWYRISESINFARGGRQDGFVLRSNEPQNAFKSRSSPALVDQRLTFSDFGPASGRPLYWELPAPFTGEKATSYGGTLMIKLAYSGSGPSNDLPDIILRGNSITMFYTDARRTQPDRDGVVTLSVRFYENLWSREDGDLVTREHLLMTLSDLDELLVKCSYQGSMRSCSLIEISMEYATERDTQQERAFAVEQCRCPVGYKGTSCEDCSRGYSRTGGGLWLGLCDKCNCNGHSSDCDPEFGMCQNCQHNTEGERCERCKAGYIGDATRGTPQDCLPESRAVACFCNNHSPRGCDSVGRCLLCEHNTEGRSCENCKPGFYGDATQGTPFDCKACPCPGARECFLEYDAQGRPQPRCKTCPPGFKGRLCEECADGYTRDETDPRKCKPIGRLTLEVVPHFLDLEEASAGEISCRIRSGKQDGMAYTLAWTRPGYNSLPSSCMDRGDGILTINDVNVADDGVYRCTASSNIAQMESEQDARLAVHQKPEPPIVTVEPGIMTVKEGEPAQFRCSAKGEPAPIVNWKIDREMRNTVTQSNGLLNIPQCDKSHAGQFQCTASNKHGESSAYATLYVDERNVPPTVNIRPVKQWDGQVGENFDFICEGRGNPPPNISWKKEEGSMNPSVTVVEQNILRISGAERSDSGKYKCTGTNPIGSATDTATVNIGPSLEVWIDVQKPAEMLTRSNVRIPEGAPLRMTCMAKGDPAPKVEWIRDVGPFRGDVPEGTKPVVIEKEVVTHPEVTDYNEGEYRCTATNGEVERTAVINLEVVTAGQRSVTIIGASEQFYRPGETVNLHCLSPANMGEEITWHRLESTLPQNAKPQGGLLTIDNFQRSDAGEYECRSTARDTGKMISRATVLLRLDGDPSQNLVEIPGSTVRVIKEGETIDLSCDAPVFVSDGSGDAGVEWHRYGRYDNIESPIEGYIAGNTIHLVDAYASDGGEFRCQLLQEPSVVLRVDHIVVSQTQKLGRSGDLEYQWAMHDNHGEGQIIENSDGDKVTIDGIDDQDQGLYTCTVTDAEGRVVGKNTIALVYHYSDKNDAVPVTSERGRNVVLDCPVYHIPGTPIQWSREDGLELPSGAVQTGTQLQIPNYDSDDTVYYVCDSSVNNQPTRGYVVVAPPSPNSEPDMLVNVDISPANLEVGQDVTMTCRVVGDHQIAPHITWTRLTGGNELPASAEMSGRILTIRGVHKSDEGTYRCHAKVGKPEAMVADGHLTVGSKRKRHSGHWPFRSNAAILSEKQRKLEELEKKLNELNKPGRFGKWFDSA